MEKKYLVRCINLKTNKIKLFPKYIAENLWWQKNTGFIPDPNNIEMSAVDAVESINEISVDVSEEKVEVIKTKRKYNRKPKNNNTNGN